MAGAAEWSNGKSAEPFASHALEILGRQYDRHEKRGILQARRFLFDKLTMMNSIRCSIAKRRYGIAQCFRFGIVAFLLVFLCWVPPVQAANLEQVQKLLQERICVGCDLRDADFKDADLRGVNLRRANLQGANLEHANLAAANLREADLRKANLTRARLVATDFSGANLKGANIAKVRYAELRLCHTIEPNGKTIDRDCP